MARIMGFVDSHGWQGSCERDFDSDVVTKLVCRGFLTRARPLLPARASVNGPLLRWQSTLDKSPPIGWKRRAGIKGDYESDYMNHADPTGHL